MRLSILGRLIISYLFLVSMLAGVSLYFIYHLNQFNSITQSISLNDTAIVDYSNQLSDALLSESRFDRKFVVLKDEELYENYLQARNKFTRLLENALSKTSSEEIKHLFNTINVQHQNFNRLVNVERELLRVAKTYPSDKYAKEKKQTADHIIKKLQKIRQISEQNVFIKIDNLDERSDKVRNVAILISVVALSTALIIAFTITRSIKTPLDVMRAKTIKISQGNFHGDLDVQSPPIISELASAINTMCQKLQELDDIKFNFFSHMSHELRTPLTSIKEGTTMLLEGIGGEISEKQQRILSIVIQESNRLIYLVNSLLDLSKMEAGMLKYQFRKTDIAVLVKSSLDTLAPLAEAKNIYIDNRIGTVSPVNVDQEKMLQVFRNIIGNAIKFTPEYGAIKIEANEGDKCIEIAVHDTGIGIPEEDLKRIFGKFQQVTPAKDERVKGTGLGLAIVKQIIFAHGGKVWATSQSGQGTTFHFTLPQAA